MKYNLTLGSLFDGIGGFPLVAMEKGITPVWASEIEKFPIEVTKLHFPEMLHLGDITQINGATIPVVDIISGGSPCQDLSVAGKRAGLEGARSGLFMEQIRVIKEMREEDAKRGRTNEFIRPRYGIWENVPGAFSSAEGEDFKAVLEEFVKLHDSTVSIPRPDNGAWKSAGAILLGRGFSLAWRVLDAQFWGVPQRRRRIYLVCDFGGTTAPQILFKQDSLFGNTAESRSSWQGTARPVASGSGDTGRSPNPIEPLLCMGDQGGERIDIEVEKTPTLRATMSGHPPLVRQPMDRTAPALFDNHARDCRYNGPLKVCPTIARVYGSGGNNIPLLSQPQSYCIVGNIIDRQVQNGGNGLGCQADLAYTLTATDVHSVCKIDSSEEEKIFGESSFGGYTEGVGTLCSSGGNNGGGSENLAVSRNLVRRLTPLECERLQGFPDHWTNIPKAADSPRYKALGNSVAIPCVEFVLNGVAYFLRKQYEME